MLINYYMEKLFVRAAAAVCNVNATRKTTLKENNIFYQRKKHNTHTHKVDVNGMGHAIYFYMLISEMYLFGFLYAIHIYIETV